MDTNQNRQEMGAEWPLSAETGMLRPSRTIRAIDAYIAFCRATESADEFAAMMIAARNSDLI